MHTVVPQASPSLLTLQPRPLILVPKAQCAIRSSRRECSMRLVETDRIDGPDVGLSVKSLIRGWFQAMAFEGEVLTVKGERLGLEVVGRGGSGEERLTQSPCHRRIY